VLVCPHLQLPYPNGLASASEQKIAFAPGPHAVPSSSLEITAGWLGYGPAAGRAVNQWQDLTVWGSLLAMTWKKFCTMGCFVPLLCNVAAQDACSAES